MNTKKTIKIFNLILMVLLLCGGAAAAEQSVKQLTVVTINAWPGLEYGGIIRCSEYEAENVREFRREVLLTGLQELNADIIVLNGINPAVSFAAEAAGVLGMSSEVRTARAGFRIGPAALPLNLAEGDAVLTVPDAGFIPAGQLHMKGLFSAGALTLLSGDAVQVVAGRLAGSPSTAAAEEDAGAAGDAEASGGREDIYVFSAVWTESIFNDRDSLQNLMNAYLNGALPAELYTEMVENAVAGAEARAEQAQETLSFINSLAGAAPVILAGSLNALPDSPEIKLLKDAGFTDVFERAGSGRGYTIDTEKNSNFRKISNAADGSSNAASVDILSGKYRADYIFIRGAGFKPVSADIVLDKPVYGVYPSNRFGVRAVIEVTE